MPPSVFFFLQDTDTDERRLGVPARRLAAAGARGKAAPALLPEDVAAYDVFVFSQPHVSGAALQGFAAVLKAGKPIVVDMSEDFFHITAEHPQSGGPGSARALQILEQVLRAASLVTISTPELAPVYGRFAGQMRIIPTGWDRANPLWDHPGPASSNKMRLGRVRLGWQGGPQDRADLAEIAPAVQRALELRPNLELVLAGDMPAYHLFDRLAEPRLLALPPVPYEDLPYVLGFFDVLLLPARATPASAGRLEPRLVEAGARRIPWVAPSLPEVTRWGAGGLTADSAEAWTAALLRLADEPELRAGLAAEGRAKAEEDDDILSAWLNSLETLKRI